MSYKVGDLIWAFGQIGYVIRIEKNLNSVDWISIQWFGTQNHKEYLGSYPINDPVSFKILS